MEKTSINRRLFEVFIDHLSTLFGGNIGEQIGTQIARHTHIIGRWCEINTNDMIELMEEWEQKNSQL